MMRNRRNNVPLLLLFVDQQEKRKIKGVLRNGEGNGRERKRKEENEILRGETRDP